MGKGTGLGLSTVFGIVSQTGGGIEVVSKLDEGTTFKVCLPRLEETADRVQPAPSAAFARGAETILVVEDYPGLRMLARRMLEMAGYTVLVAGSGREALKVLESYDGPVHLLLTDVVMPGLSGRELGEQVAETHPEIKVVYTSGYNEDALMRHGIDTAEAPFVAKPYTSAALTAAVRKALDAG